MYGQGCNGAVCYCDDQDGCNGASKMSDWLYTFSSILVLMINILWILLKAQMFIHKLNKISLFEYAVDDELRLVWRLLNTDKRLELQDHVTLTSALELEGEADLVTSLVKVLAVYQGGEAEADPRPDVLLVAQTYLTWVVDLGAEAASLLQVIFEADTETCCVTWGRPAQVHASLNIRLNLSS